VSTGEEPSADAPPPPAAGVRVPPGWYPVDQQTNTQAYWDGQRWSDTRHWRGTGWVEDSAGSVSGTDTVYSSSYAALTRPPRSQSTLDAPPPMAGSHPVPGAVQPMMRTTNGMAIASLVLSILGLFGIGSLLGIIFGYKARREIRASRGAEGGDGLALAGIIIGFVTLILFALVLAFWIAAFATIRSDQDAAASPQQQQIAQCQADTKSVEVAVQAYFAHTDTFPVPAAPWNALSYTANFAPLTTADEGGPYLHEAPETSSYVVEYDSDGNVWVAPANMYGASYTSNQDLGVNSGACQAAVTG
jgi:Na+-transporting methylmalonyl-CoA/oxaloacetate decarboxylase gamma subunit